MLTPNAYGEFNGWEGEFKASKEKNKQPQSQLFIYLFTGLFIF